MSAVVPTVTIQCDWCFVKLPTRHTTTQGARGHAERAGWLVAYLAGGAHPAKRSGDKDARDLCPVCRPDRPKADVGLFAKGVE